MRVMIVDDDILIREEIKSYVDWESGQYSLVKEASNGEEAYRWLAQNEADIIITDIAMPLMDGVELIRRLRANDFPGEILVMSNFDDFDYVKDAMKWGAFDYCLKYKMSPQSVSEVLGALCEQLRRHSKEKGSEQAAHAKQTQLLQRALNHSPSEQEAEEYRRLCPLNYHMLLISISPVPAAFGLHADLSDGILGYMFPISPAEAVVLVCLEGNSYTQKEKQLQRIALAIAQGEPACHIVYDGRGAACPDLFSRLSKMRQTARYYFYSGKELQLHEGEVSFAPTIPQGLKNTTAQAVFDALAVLDNARLKEAFEAFSACVRQQKVEPQAIIRFFENLVDQTAQDMELRGLPSYANKEYADLIALYNSPQATLHELVRRYQLWADTLFQWSKTTRKKEIIRALQYIQQNYHQDISLRDIADHVALSRNHFCSLFKKETGENFINYLAKVRIEKAKSLLMDPQNQIQQVGQLVGINNPRYFGKLFKDLTGMTPTQYREKPI